MEQSLTLPISLLAVGAEDGPPPIPPAPPDAVAVDDEDARRSTE